MTTIGFNGKQKIAFYLTNFLSSSFLLYINPPISVDATSHILTHATRTPAGPLLHFLINTRTGFRVFF